MSFWIIFANNSWPVYCSEVQPKTQAAKSQLSASYPPMEALLLIQCVWYSCWKRPHLKLASWKHTLTFTWKFWCRKKNYSSSKCLFLDYWERKDRKITQQWECCLQGACSLFHQPMSCPCRLRSVTPRAPQRHQRAHVTPSGKFLKSELLYV